VEAARRHRAEAAADAIGGGDEEAPVATGRIEDAQTLGRGAGGQHRLEHFVEDVADQGRRRVPGAERLSCHGVNGFEGRCHA
jgi:hypothetical protein